MLIEESYIGDRNGLLETDTTKLMIGEFHVGFLTQASKDGRHTLFGNFVGGVGTLDYLAVEVGEPDIKLTAWLSCLISIPAISSFFNRHSVSARYRIIAMNTVSDQGRTKHGPRSRDSVYVQVLIQRQTPVDTLDEVSMRELTRAATRPTIALVLALLSISPVTAQKKPVRVAVIIGNGAYPNPAHLTNPPNDATSMKRALEMLGFQVHLTLNASKDDMVSLGQDAKRWFAGSDVGLFFYAGHGLQINNENFIVPVDVSFAKTNDISTELFSLSETLEWMDNTPQQT